MNLTTLRLFSLLAAVLCAGGATQLHAQPASVRYFEWAKGLLIRDIHFACSDPWDCIVSITTVTRGGVTVHDVFGVGTDPPSTSSVIGSVTLEPLINSGYPIYSIASGDGVKCLEIREWYRETPVVWTKRGHDAFKVTTHQKGYRVLWGRDSHGGAARVCFSDSHALLYSEFTAQDELVDKRIDLESFRTSNPGAFSNFWWADAFTVLPDGNLLFVNAKVGVTHAAIDSLGRIERDSVEKRLGYYLIDVDQPENSRFGSADLDRASMGSVPASMGRQVECLKNSHGEIWFLVETQGYRDPSDRTGFLDTSVSSLALVSFVIDGETVSIGSNSHPRLAPSTQIDDPIHRIVCVAGENTVDGIKIIDIGKDGAIFIDQF